MNTIFPILSIDQKIINWAAFLSEATPVEEVGNLSFKREDYFAPLGYGGINGSKLRQAIWLFEAQFKNDQGSLISGTSVKSPQLPMGSAVALHYGKKSLHVIGATKPETSIRRDMVQMATWFKAEFDYIKVGYNPALQKRVKDLISLRNNDDSYLEYGITLNHKKNPISAVSGFHEIGGKQTKNLPDHIEKMIIPAGSCNSSTSILLGLTRNRPKDLKEIHLVGIGPTKLKYLTERLEKIGEFQKRETRIFKGLPYKPSGLLTKALPEQPIKVFYYDLHASGYVDYQQEMKYQYEDIELHPTYEGKVMTYVQDKLKHLEDKNTLFWIVGSKPRIENMLPICPELGPIPEKVNVYGGMNC